MNIYDLLEFSRIQEKIASFAKTELGISYAKEVLPYQSERKATDALAHVNEASVILSRFGTLPLSQSHNLAPLLNEARRGNTLTPHDFYLISADINNINRLNEFLKDKLKDAPLLKVMLTKELDLKFLSNEIEKIISPNLTIKDNASHELARIRKNIRSSEERLTKAANSLLMKYGAYLAEQLITKREGHFVIPLKTVHKNKVDGIIYDISNSGQTIFIEPQEIAILNNTLISYQNDEIIEVNRLLRALTQKTLEYEDDIISNNVLLAEIDLIFAKGEYGLKINGIIPTFRKEVGLSFKDARHPLLDPKTVVPNSFHLTSEKYIIVISGPNAGGKTVALKTMGILVLMAKSGLMLPVSEQPTLYFYGEVYASIGDEQSLTANLSTFSSHVKRIGEILAVATKDDLVLLDELATGTSPEEGEALALAVSDYLRSHHISAIISSHYSRLKQYAYDHPGILNASMAFDEHNLKPLYIFSENVPGRSYGLVVAKRFGISEAVIKYAESVLQKGVYEFEQTIGALRAKIHDVETKEAELFAKEKALRAAEEKVRRLDQRLQNELVRFNDEKDERLKEEVDDALKKLDSLVKTTLQTGGKAHEIIAKKSEVEALFKREEEVPLDHDETFSEGDYVTVMSIGVKGRITKIKEGTATVTLESGKHLKVNIATLKQSEAPVYKKKAPVVMTELDQNVASVKPEINLIGLRVSEAVALLGPYLDRALLKHFPKVTIIHGFGSGALRRGIHEYLKTVPFVKSFALGGEYDGQGGATVVTF